MVAMHFRHTAWVSRPPSSRQHAVAHARSAISLHVSAPRAFSTVKFNGAKFRRQPQTARSRGLGPESRRFPRCYSTTTLKRSQGVSAEQGHDSNTDANTDAGLVGRANQASLNIAVLGGGITGLATTYFLTQKFPNARISLIEKQPALGGWIQTKTVGVPGGDITFEQGPRTLRPNGVNGRLMVNVVRELGLLDELLITPKSSPAAANRFIYYPDHLVRLGPPKDFQDLLLLLREPLMKGAFSWVWRDFWGDSRDFKMRDESVGAFLSRRLGKGLVDRIASAGLHGIYAGDIWNLSARSVLPLLWHSELKFQGFGAQMRSAFFKSEYWGFCDDLELLRHLHNTLPPIQVPDPSTGEPAWFEDVCSVYTFKKGLRQLSDALEEHLRQSPNVKLLKSTLATEMKRISLNRVQMTLREIGNQSNGNGKPQAFDQVISTINPRMLHQLMPKDVFTTFESRLQSPRGPPRAEPHAVTVMVVNLYFRTPLLLTKIHPPGGLPHGLGPEGLRGFGYLIPSDLPYEQNPECALGVIFDSDISALHSSVPPEKQGTKLTVMMGGHLWDGLDRYPTPVEAESRALAVLHRHLGISEDPVAANAVLQRECIPQYQVGHSERMEEAHYAYLEAYGGLLKVAGSWYTGVGVNDCVRAGFDIVQSLDECVSPRPGIEVPPDRTGLRQFTPLGRPMMKYRLLPKAPGASESTIVRLDVEEAGLRTGHVKL